MAMLRSFLWMHGTLFGSYEPFFLSGQAERLYFVTFSLSGYLKWVLNRTYFCWCVVVMRLLCVEGERVLVGILAADLRMDG